jgi:hypothetical protein
MKSIKLTQGKEAIVDNEHFDELNQYKWSCDSHGYAVRFTTIQSQNKKLGIKQKRKTILMHKVINNTPDGFHTDHINGNTLDNRKDNLRTATASQNQGNTNKRVNNTSGFKGVSWSKRANKWVAQIRCNNQQLYLGLFDNLQEAAIAYNNKALELFGEFASIGELKIISSAGTITILASP